MYKLLTFVFFIAPAVTARYSDAIANLEAAPAYVRSYFSSELQEVEKAERNFITAFVPRRIYIECTGAHEERACRKQDETCANQGQNNPEANNSCLVECFCVKGYARNQEGHCILKGDCPATQKPQAIDTKAAVSPTKSVVPKPRPRPKRESPN